MDYNPQYTDEDLRDMGYNQSEIDEMRSRIAGTVQKTALDKDTSLATSCTTTASSARKRPRRA